MIRTYITRLLALGLLLLAFGSTLQAQRGFGFRFGTEFNYFFRAQNHPLVDGWWSHMKVGPYYQAYFDNGGAQVGINLLYKNDRETGFPNFPVIQRDFSDDQSIGITALELDLKVGPRFGLINPKIGYLIGYYFRREGFLEDGQTADLNRVFVSLPFGVSIEGPTGYGSVGFSAFYNIGLNNVIRNPTPQGLQDWDGSKIRGLSFEFLVLFEAGSQKRKIPPSERLPEEYEEAPQ
jgi:hypothetical protein